MTSKWAERARSSPYYPGAVIWGPWMSLSMGVFQDASPPGALAQVLVSALATIALGLVTVAALLLARRAR